MDKIIAAIFAVPDEFKDRLFDGKPKVFVKYLARNSTKLAPGHKIVFYASHGSKKLIGEGIIERIEFLVPDEVIKRYRDRLFLQQNEFYAYVKRFPARSASKEMLVILLRGLQKFQKAIEYWRPITMAGQYLHAEEYRSLMKDQV